MGLSRTVSDINEDFSRKSQIFQPPVYLTPPLKGFPLQLGIGTWGKETTMTALPCRERSLTISLAMWIQYKNMMDKEMDGQTPGDSKDQAYA